MINIGKLFENNNQTLIQKPSSELRSKAYVLYKKCFENLMLMGVWGCIHGFLGQLGQKWSFGLIMKALAPGEIKNKLFLIF